MRFMSELALVRWRAAPAQGGRHELPEVLIRGRLVRYIDIPPSVDIMAAIAAKQAAMLAGRTAYARKPKRRLDGS